MWLAQSHVCTFPNTFVYIRCPPTCWMEYLFFLGFCKGSSWWLPFPQDCHANECDFHDKFLVFYIYGATQPIFKVISFLALRCFDIRATPTSNPLIEHHRARLSCSVTPFLCFLMHSDPYWIWSRCTFLRHIDSQWLFSGLSLLMKTPCLIQFLYLWHFSHISDVFSLFTLTLFAMTGRPGSVNLQETESPSTLLLPNRSFSAISANRKYDLPSSLPLESYSHAPHLSHLFPHLGLLSDLRSFSAEILLSYYIALVS